MRKVTVLAVVALAVAFLPAGARATEDPAELQSALDAYLTFDPLANLSDTGITVGSSDGKDFAVGGGIAGTLQGTDNPNPPPPNIPEVQFAISAHQTEGFLAKGHLRVREPGGDFRADVVCLSVIGNTAHMVGNVTAGAAPSEQLAVNVVDSRQPGGSGDLFRHTFTSGFPRPASCGAEPPGVRFVLKGNIVVRDDTG